MTPTEIVTYVSWTRYSSLLYTPHTLCVLFPILDEYPKRLPEGLPLRPNSFDKLLPITPTLPLLCQHLGARVLLFLCQRSIDPHCIRCAIEFLCDGGRRMCVWCERIVFSS